MQIVCSTAAVFTGLLLDCLFGDPNVWWHPICLIGRLIAALEKLLHKNIKNTPLRERINGCLLVLLVTLSATLSAILLLALAYALHWLAGYLLESFLCWFLLAGKCLRTESMKVLAALREEGLDGGRRLVSMIVGRDTQQLNEEGVVKATVETVAENTSDGVVAPLFYMLIGGAPLGVLYKSINTMDSMVGYKNEKYINFGRCAARLDDVVNYIPARLCAFLMLAAVWVSGFCNRLRVGEKKENRSFSFQNALFVYRRDRKKHASPNSAQTESVMAGALGVRLAGDAVYFGTLYKKPYIGEALRPIETGDIERAGDLMERTLLLAAISGFALKGLVLVCMSMAGIFTII